MGNQDTSNDFLAILLGGHRFIVTLCVAVVFLTGVFTVRHKYPSRAQAVVMPWVSNPSPSASLAGGLSERLGVLDLRQSSVPSTMFTTLLRSRHLAERVVARLRLDEKIPWGAGGLERRQEMAVRWVLGSVGAQQQSGMYYMMQQYPITITATDLDPVAAADMANACVFELDRLIAEGGIGSAGKLRDFIAERLATVNREMELAQAKLRRFEETHGAVSIPQQAEATVKVLSELEAQRVAGEVELRARQQALTTSHSVVRQLQARVDALQRNIERLTYSQADSISIEQEGRVRYYLPLTQIPELGFEAARLELQVKIHEGVLSLLSSQLEQAKIEERRNLPSITVVDVAVPQPPRRLRRLVVNLLVAGALSLSSGVVIVFAGHFVQRERARGKERSRIEALIAVGRDDVAAARTGLGWLAGSSRSLIRRLGLVDRRGRQ